MRLIVVIASVLIHLAPIGAADPAPPTIAPNDLAARVAALEAARSPQWLQLAVQAQQISQIRAELAELRASLVRVSPATVAGGPVATASGPVCDSGQCAGVSTGRRGRLGRWAR